MSASNGIRPKIRIRPPKANTESDFTNALAIVNDAVRVIYLKSASLLSFEEIYRNAYFLTLHRRGDILYKSLIVTVRELLQDKIKVDLGPMVTDFSTNQMTCDQASLFLERMLSIWDHFTMAMNLVSDVLMYLDKNYLKDKKLPVAWEMGLLQFRDHVLRSNILAIRPLLRKSMLTYINAERTETLPHATLMKRVITMMVDLRDGSCDPLCMLLLCLHENVEYLIKCMVEIAQRHPTRLFGEDIRPGSVYASDFEIYFFDSTREYYRQVSLDLASRVDVSTYLSQVEEWISEEDNRAQAYLQPHSRTELRNITQTETVIKHVPYIISGIESRLPLAIVDPDSILSTLRRAYMLFSDVKNGLPLLQKAVTEMIERFGQEGVFTVQPTTSESTGLGRSTKNDLGGGVNEEAMKWVPHVTKLLQVSNRLLTECFNEDPSFERGMHTSETIVINHEVKAAEYLAVYLDIHLRRGLKITELETETNIKNALNVFKFIQNKDVFQRNYNQKLARRLLRKMSSSDEFENLVINELRNSCGSQFTLQYEKMIQDIHMSTELSTNYEAVRRTKSASTSTQPPNKQVGFSINILTAAMWPISNEGLTSIYPINIQNLKSDFETYYGKIHANRTIRWCHSLGTAEMTAFYHRGRKELSVSTSVMIVLMKYNEKQSWTLNELCVETQIPENELKRTLASICSGKLNLLVKQSPSNNQFSSQDTYTYNAEFTDKRTKIKVPVFVGTTPMELDKDRELNTAYIEEERKVLTDAAIVRVMKSRGQVEHNDLVIQVTGLLSHRFCPAPNLIKVRIEALIDREYMERSNSNSRMYSYIA